MIPESDMSCQLYLSATTGPALNITSIAKVVENSYVINTDVGDLIIDDLDVFHSATKFRNTTRRQLQIELRRYTPAEWYFSAVPRLNIMLRHEGKSMKDFDGEMEPLAEWAHVNQYLLL